MFVLYYVVDISLINIRDFEFYEVLFDLCLAPVRRYLVFLTVPYNLISIINVGKTLLCNVFNPKKRYEIWLINPIKTKCKI